VKIVYMLKKSVLKTIKIRLLARKTDLDNPVAIVPPIPVI
jgi:hypothetical protein